MKRRKLEFESFMQLAEREGSSISDNDHMKKKKEIIIK